MTTHWIVNGRTQEVDISGGVRLIDVLRDQLGLTGTKQACRSGECGACTVLLAGKPLQACITLAVRVRGSIETVEGLAPRLTALRQALADEGGFQCGFCTPGQLVMAAAILMKAPLARLTDERWLREQMNGNICRCTGYGGIFRALTNRDIQRLAAELQNMAEGAQTSEAISSNPRGRREDEQI